MAKQTKKAGASRIEKKGADTKPKKPQPSKKAEPIVEHDKDEWEDESDEEMADAPVAKATKAKKAATGKHDSSDESSDESEGGFDLAALDESDSDSELEPEDAKDDDESASEDEEEEIDVDELDIENSSDEEEIAATTRVRETINNKDALLAALRRIAIDTSSSVPFAFHQSVLSSMLTADAIPSVDDDLQRELAFSNQALEAARRARTLLCKEGVPFTRPTDYFAETVRSDETMEKVKAKMIEEATAKKASAEARKQRDLKKFGKQVQVAKQQERAKQKREALEKIELLKKKRKDGASSALGTNEADDLFDVAVENELKTGGGKKRSFSAGDHGPPNPKRQKKDAKFGFGGKKKHLKSNDGISSGDLSGFSAKRMKSGGSSGPGGKKKPIKATRPGKARRKAGAGKR